MNYSPIHISAPLLHFQLGRNTLLVHLPYKVMQVIKTEAIQKELCIVQATSIAENKQSLALKLNCDAGRTSLDFEIKSENHSEPITISFPVLVSSAGKDSIEIQL